MENLRPRAKSTRSVNGDESTRGRKRKGKEDRPAPKEDPSLSILGVDDILGVEHRGAANVDRLLAKARHVEGDAALALGVVQNVVEHVERHHGFVHLLRHLFAHLLG